MKIVPLAKVDKDTPESMENERPVYPYGTCLYLDEDTLAALGVKEMPPVGTIVTIQAKAKITGTSEREYEKDGATAVRKTLDVQITDLGFEGKKKSAAETLYGE